MKIKRGKGLLAAVALCAAFGLFASCNDSDNGGNNGGDGNKTVTLVDFTDATDTAKVGDAYEVKNPAIKDADGKEYTPEVVVKDAAGNVIPTIGGSVEIRNVNGYVIEYTIKIGDQTYTKKITLSVTDDQKPVINIASPDAAYINEEYTLPAVTVRDNAENAVTTEKKLYFVNGETKTEIATENGKFTPAQKGTYEYCVKATDAAGNVAEKSVTFSAVTKLGHFVLADFSDNADNATSDKRFASANAEVGWVESFEGATGVSWTKGGSQAYKNFSYRFGATEAEMKAYEEEGWDYYSIRLYIDQEGSFRVLSWNTDYVNANGEDTNASPVAGKQWVTVYMPKTTIGDASKQTFWQNVDEPYGGGETGMNAFNTAPLRENGCVLFWITNLADDTKVYVDEIRLEHGANLSVTGIADRVVAGDTVSFTVNNPLNLEYEAKVTYNGNAVELENDLASFVATEAGEYKLTVLNKSAGYVGACEVTINVLPKYTLTAADIPNTTVNTEITLPHATVKDEKTNTDLTDAAVDLYLQIGKSTPASLASYTLIPVAKGTYTVIYRYTDTEGTTYELKKTFEVTGTEKYFTSFEDAEIFENVTADDGSSITQSSEQKTSGTYSAKVVLAANKQAKINFATPLKQKITAIGFMAYFDGSTQNFQFRISTGAYTLNGVEVAAKADEVHAVKLTNGWNYYVIDIPASDATKITVDDIINGGITAFGFNFEKAVTFYLDDIEFMSSDIAFESDDQHSTSWDADHPNATKSSEFAHSGKYSAKFTYSNTSGNVSVFYSGTPYSVPSGAKKIGFWLYNDGAAAAISFGCASSGFYTFDVCNTSFVAESGWGYYEFKMSATPTGIVQFNLWTNGALNQSFYLDDLNFVTTDITFETDEENSTTWDADHPWATKSSEYAHSGKYSAKFAFGGKDGTISVFHANNPYSVPTGATKIGFWLYNDGAAAPLSFGCAASAFYSLNVCNTAFIAESGWGYYEFTMNETPTSVVQFTLWSGSALNQSFYLDDVTFLK